MMQRSFLAHVPVSTAMSIATRPPQHFTLNEWYLHTRARTRSTDDQLQLAERVQQENARVRDHVDDITRLNKVEVDRRLQERSQQLCFRRDELMEQKKQCCIEEEAMCLYKERILDALRALSQNALRTCQKCLALREMRLGVDLTHDDAERELRKEMEVIVGAQALLERTLERLQEQLRTLRSTKYFIDRDIADKETAIDIDDKCVKLLPTSLHLSLYEGKAPLDAGIVSLEEWMTYTSKNMERAAHEVNTARPMRSYVDMLLRQVIDDLREQYRLTNDAFRRRIEETRDAKSKLEQHHYEIVKKVADINSSIHELEKAIVDKEQFLALAHTRLGNRGQRPGIELTNDEAEIRLMAEVKSLQDNLATLRNSLAEGQALRRYLLRQQLQLEEDINVKTNTLKIDEVDCMTLRLGMEYFSY